MGRGLTKSEAAAHCGLSCSGFDAWRKLGRVPGPMEGTHRWDIKALDDALDRLSGIKATIGERPYDRWKEADNARQVAGNKQGQKKAS